MATLDQHIDFYNDLPTLDIQSNRNWGKVFGLQKRFRKNHQHLRRYDFYV